MVLAEVPLWVVHSLCNNHNGGTGAGPNVGRNGVVPVNGLHGSSSKVDRGNGHNSSSSHNNSNNAMSETIRVLSGTASRCAIYSIDVHPDGTRFATAGGDGRVRIWSTDAVFPTKKGNEPEDSSSENESRSSSSETDHRPHHHSKRKKKLLCSLSAHHTGSVLCVRWSHSGATLASSGDDSNVVLYRRRDRPRPYTQDGQRNEEQGGFDDNNNNMSNIVDNELVDTEDWVRTATLRGHDLDAVGLAWAPDDSHLISCSLDCANPVVVWKLVGDENDENGNAQDLLSLSKPSLIHPHAVLGRDEHRSTVKGVAFDPAGTYVATSGDDPAICIWRTEDWTLEKRVDGLLSPSNNKSAEAATSTDLTLFRRLSFAPDGTHICGTNAVLRGKHVAAMLARSDGWKCALDDDNNNSNNNDGGTATLVGHKQPVVSSRHCPYFLMGPKESFDSEDDENDEAVEPSYSMLLAIGDKRGFVSVWSTGSTRPIFKLQCSETRCTVTDLSWGRSGNDILWLFVSMLDGHVVVLRFLVDKHGNDNDSNNDNDADVDVDVDAFLPDDRCARIFGLKYGLELGVNGRGSKHRVVGQSGLDHLIENAALHYHTLQDKDNIDNEDKVDKDKEEDRPLVTTLTPRSKRTAHDDPPPSSISITQHGSSGSSQKKRIRPITTSDFSDGGSARKRSEPTIPSSTSMVSSDVNVLTAKKKKPKNSGSSSGSIPQSRRGVDHPLSSLITSPSSSNAALTSSSSRPSASSVSANRGVGGGRTALTSGTTTTTTNSHSHKVVSEVLPLELLPPDGVLSLDLPVPPDSEDLNEPSTSNTTTSFGGGRGRRRLLPTADCVNKNRGGSGSGTCVLSIGIDGECTWRDTHSRGTRATCMAASTYVLALGTHDGSLFLYGTSLTTGFRSGVAYRCGPPLVFGGSIVGLHVEDGRGDGTSTTLQSPEKDIYSHLLVLSSDGRFGVYALCPSSSGVITDKVLPATPTIRLLYGGSVLPSVHNMRVRCAAGGGGRSLADPRIARAVLVRRRCVATKEADTSELTQWAPLLVLSSSSPHPHDTHNAAYLYDPSTEAWQRVADGNSFVASHYHTTLPHHVRFGDDDGESGTNTHQPQRHQPSESTLWMNDLQRLCSRMDRPLSTDADVTAAHCEDRMALAHILSTTSDPHDDHEHRRWLRRYARFLGKENDEARLRLLVDRLLRPADHSETNTPTEEKNATSTATVSATTQRQKDLLKDVVAEIGRFRHLQRLANEIAFEIETM